MLKLFLSDFLTKQYWRLAMDIPPTTERGVTWTSSWVGASLLQTWISTKIRQTMLLIQRVSFKDIKKFWTLFSANWVSLIYVYNKREAFIVFRFNSEILRITSLTFKLFFLYSCKRQMTTHLHTRYHQSDAEASQTWVNAVVYTPTGTHDTRFPKACETIAFHFWYQHASVVMYVLFTMWSKLWIDIFVLMMFLRKEDFPCPFFPPTRRETWETSVHHAWIFRRVAWTASFRPWSCRCHARGLENMFHPFFRSHRRKRLAQLKFGELLRGRLREWQRCERAVCHTIQSFFLEKTMTPLLWPGTQEASICSATKRRATRIGTPSRRLVKTFHPQRSDKSPGSDGSGGTNFVNLKKKAVFK